MTQERAVHGSELLKRLEYDRRIILDYGIPFSTIPYRLIETFEDDGTDEAFYKACDLVEQEKDQGKPGAFIIERFDSDEYEVWGWANE